MTIVKFNNSYVELFVNDIFILRNYENDIHIFTLRIDTWSNYKEETSA